MGSQGVIPHCEYVIFGVHKHFREAMIRTRTLLCGVTVIALGAAACSDPFEIARADHGVGITEENSAKFGGTTSRYDFGDGVRGSTSYSLNLFVR